MAIAAVVFDAYGTLFDVQSVAAATEAAFPGHGTVITQLWRLKQLEYTWLRSLMGRYAEFGTVTRDSLAYALETLGLPATPADIARLAEAYDALSLYPEAREALQALAPLRLAIFSNGSPPMLARLVEQAGIAPLLETVISVDEIGAYKPRAAAGGGFGGTPSPAPAPSAGWGGASPPAASGASTPPWKRNAA